jgi:hypothetical protein
MIFSGLLFPFEKLNDTFSTRGKVPFVADLMASRWAYEAMAVHQFTHNSFEDPLYRYDKLISAANFRATYLADELEKRRIFIEENISNNNDSIQRLIGNNLRIMEHSFRNESFGKFPGLMEGKLAAFNSGGDSEMGDYLDGYKRYYTDIYNRAVASRDQIIDSWESHNGDEGRVTRLKNRFYNESLADLVKNVAEKDRIIEYEGRLIQQIDPVFQDPLPEHVFDYRTHFFAPQKNLLGSLVSTYWFNLLVIWIMTMVLYCTLYVDALKRIVSLPVFPRGPMRNRK